MNGSASLVQRDAQNTQLIELLQRECEPRFHLGIELLFTLQIDRYVQQRARWCNPQLLTPSLGKRLKPVEYRVQIGLPDVATVDHAQRNDLVRGQQIDHRQHVVAALERIDVQARHGQVGGQIGVLLQRPKIGGEQQLGATAFEVVVRGVERVLPIGIQLGHQNRLVHLHPLHALRGQRVEQLRIDLQQARQQGELVGVILGLADRQIRDRADDHRLGPNALGLGLGQLFEQARGIELELGRRGEFRHDVVVVGVEPLGHLPRGHAAAAR